MLWAHARLQPSRSLTHSASALSGTLLAEHGSVCALLALTNERQALGQCLDGHSKRTKMSLKTCHFGVEHQQGLESDRLSSEKT